MSANVNATADFAAASSVYRRERGMSPRSFKCNVEVMEHSLDMSRNTASQEINRILGLHPDLSLEGFWRAGYLPWRSEHAFIEGRHALRKPWRQEVFIWARTFLAARAQDLLPAERRCPGDDFSVYLPVFAEEVAPSIPQCGRCEEGIILLAAYSLGFAVLRRPGVWTGCLELRLCREDGA